jgi:FkbM family methyltransferase
MPLTARRFLWKIGRRAYMSARREEPNAIATNGEAMLQSRLVQVVAPAEKLVVFDVGARVGEWSLSMAEHARARRAGWELHAFEPVPGSRIRLEQSLAGYIAAGDVRVNQFALSNRAGSLRIHVPHERAGTSTLYPDDTNSYAQDFDVDTQTIDSYCDTHSLAHVHFLKIDTEGSDYRVIEGAADGLRRERIDILQFEYNHRWVFSRTYLRDVFDAVRGLPYHVARICSDGLEIYLDWHPELERFFEANYALIHSRFVERLGCRVLRIGKGNVCEYARV